MCTRKKRIFNRYAGQWLYVDCGTCPCCLQQKANRRATRIRNHAQTTGQIGVFVTLTYDNDYIPYIRKSDVVLGANVPVYRDNTVRRVNGHHTDDGFEVIDKKIPLSDPIEYRPLKFTSENALKRFNPSSFDAQKLPTLRKFVNRKPTVVKDKVGVALYSDFQKFYKRLHINYERDFGTKLDTSFYACTEYGESYRRPHIHAIMFCKPEEFGQLRQSIRKAWPYDTNHLDVQVARNCASYVSSYINCGSNFPRLLKEFFRPKCAYSRNFGLDSRAFHLDAILEKIKSGDLRYLAKRTLDGILEPKLLPIPHYVLHRFFPKCKGYSRLSTDEAFRVALSPAFPLCERKYELGITPTEIRQYATRLQHCYERFRDFCISCGKTATRYDYALYHSACWRAYYSTLIKSSHEDAGLIPFGEDYEFYENIEQVYKGEVKAILPAPPPVHQRVYSPNHFGSNIRITATMTDLYNKKLKRAKTTNLVMTQMTYNV